MTDTSVTLLNPLEPAKSQTLMRLATYLIGADIRRLAAPATLDWVLPLVRSEVHSRSRCPLAHRLSEELAEGSFSRARQVIGTMVKGMEKGM